MSQSRYDLRQERKREALKYHEDGRPGKSEVIPTKPFATARDLSNAYSPGVAWPCREIAETPEDAFRYTNRGNLVAVISNGSAVLGLGNIGSLASKPVMEGKGILFKKFADIDVFDIEINDKTVDEMVRTISSLEPTFGGINLEDIKAPECFEVEAQLKAKLDIPVFHDDQHGTAIITCAAFINALEVTQRKIQEVKIVFSGAGAASMACAKLMIDMGLKKENLFMCDSKGVIYKGRKEGMNKYKENFATTQKLETLAEAMKDADAFIGLSMKGVLTKDMVKTMSKDPIIFAMANPDPEILPEEVLEVRSDAIMATGRSDYPNQVNNVLGFPFIFRGALDVRASTINEEMKLAAVYAIAKLAKEPAPDEVKRAYGNKNFEFGREYLIPKPFDTRVLTRVAPAVAQAAIDSGVAKLKIEDMNQYALSLGRRLGNSSPFLNSLRPMIRRTKNKSRLTFTEGDSPKILEAVSILKDHGDIEPILLGREEKVRENIKRLGINNLDDVEVIHPVRDPRFKDYYMDFYQSRQRKGVSLDYARVTMERNLYFGSTMVKRGDADGMIAGLGMAYQKAFKPIMRVIGKRNMKAAGVMILNFRNKVIFMTDCTLQMNPNAADLSEIALNASELYKSLIGKDPRVAFLSFSSFGSSSSEVSKKMAEAMKLTAQAAPHLIVDGEMQADIAVNNELLKSLFDFTKLDQAADILVFPDLTSSNISYKLLSQLGGATPIGPIITPIDYPINIVQRTASIEEIISISQLTAIIACQSKNQNKDANHENYY